MNIDFIHDKTLVKLFILKKNNRIRYCFHNVMETDKYPCIKNYILNRYPDSLSPQETLRRMEYDIDERPRCIVCGKDVQYIGLPGKVFGKGEDKLFKPFCCKSCANKHNYEKAKKTKIEKYGSSNNEQKRKQTCLEKYGDENYNNHEQTVKTNIERYGGVAPACNEEIHNKIVKSFKKTYAEKGDEIDAKKKQTTLERYGDENYRNVEQIKETWKNKSEEQRQVILNRTRQTLIEKYGNINYRNIEKAKQTKIEKYGNENYNNMTKNKQTCIERYGVDSFSKTKKFKQYMSKLWNNEEYVKKIYDTMKKNRTSKFSKAENKVYDMLCEKLSKENIIRQHRSKLYPFNCDFYIKSLNMYIEYQGFYTHNFKPYNINDENDIKQAEEFLNNPKRYNTWETWTIRDVLKRETARINNLNFVELWNLKEAEEFINNL